MEEKEIGWRRAKQIAEKEMDNGNFTIDDVREDLKQLRETRMKKMNMIQGNHLNNHYWK